MSAPALAPPSPDAAPERSRRRPGRARRILVSVLLQIVAMAGIGLLVYPDAADWFARLDHNAEISGYVDTVAQTVTGERKAMLDAAYAYNDQLQPGRSSTRTSARAARTPIPPCTPPTSSCCR